MKQKQKALQRYGTRSNSGKPGTTDESRKCSHGNVNECAPPLAENHRNAHTKNLVSFDCHFVSFDWIV